MNNTRIIDMVEAWSGLDNDLKEELPFFLFCKNQYGEYYSDCYRSKEPAMSFDEYVNGIKHDDFVNSLECV